MFVVDSDGIVCEEGVEVLGFNSLLEILGVVVLSSDGSVVASVEETSSSFKSMLSADATTVSLFFWPQNLPLFLGRPRLILFLVGIVFAKVVPCRRYCAFD